MPSQTFAIALKRRQARQQRRRAAYWQETLAQEREAKAREVVVDLFVRHASYVYGLYGLKPPPGTRADITRRLAEQTQFSACAMLECWRKAGTLEAARRARPAREAQAPSHALAESVQHLQQPILIKWYAGRRFYDTVRGLYVTREDIDAMARAGHMVLVQDARTGDDVTAQIVRPSQVVNP